MSDDRNTASHDHLDAISALFDSDREAERAGRDLADELHLDGDMVLVDHVSPEAADHGGEALLVAYVPDDQRTHAREVIGTHRGRHVPLDWVQGANEVVDADTVG
jgi:hypothetical protein